MNVDQNNIALVSIITSGVVAVSSVIFPILLNLIADRAKWIRERKAAEIENISKVTIELLDILADFRSGDVQSAAGIHPNKAKSDVISAFYTWERTIWHRLKVLEQAEVKGLRKQFEDCTNQTLFENGPRLVDRILQITSIVEYRVR